MGIFGKTYGVQKKLVGKCRVDISILVQALMVLFLI